CWPPERMAALLDHVAERGFAIAVTGAPDVREREIVMATIAACAESTRACIADLSGRLTLAELGAVTARARAFVGVDSAPMHIAAAMGTPALALFGPSSEHVWGPWQVAHRVVTSDLHPCRPCNLDGCGGGKVSECLTTLPVDRAVAAFDALLHQTESGAR
ncbi:MAG: glycosyltransferase family 9 protein, partial [Casimicrobiaceae bacterium]